MKTLKTKLTAVVQAGDKNRTLEIPASVFSSAAEQLRWDALRAGNLDAREWYTLQAFVSPVDLDHNKPMRDFVFAITLTGAHKDIKTLYRPRELQRLGLYLECQFPGVLTSGYMLELHWRGPDQMEVPLAPLQLPLPVENLPSAEERNAKIEAEPNRLLVTDKARKQLVVLYKQSLNEKREAGGCLLGRLVDLDTIAIESVEHAPDRGASANEFVFEPNFWLEINRLSRQSGNSIVGWVHSHLCDNGYPRNLSLVDYVTSHMFFNAPWLTTALVCVSRQSPDVKWFGWLNGTLLDQSDRTEYIASAH